MKRLIIFSILASFIALSPLYGQQSRSDKQAIEKIKKEEKKQKEKDKKEAEKEKQALKKQKEKDKKEALKQKEKDRKEASKQKQKDRKEQEKQKKEALKQKQSLKKNIQEVKKENKEQEKKQAQKTVSNKKQSQLSEAQKEKLAEIKFLEELKKQEKEAKKQEKANKKRQNKKNEPTQKVVQREVPKQVTRSNKNSSDLDNTKTEAKSETKTEQKNKTPIEQKKQSPTSASASASKKQALPQQNNANDIVDSEGFNPKDSTYTFDFVANDSIFYISFKNNKQELQRLQELIKQLDMDKYYISVKGYSNFSESKSESLQRAKFLSNQIKSRLIIINNVVEQDFKTYNSGGELLTYEQQRVIITFIDATDKNKVTRPQKSDQELKDLFEKQNDKNTVVNNNTNVKSQNAERQQVSSINETTKNNNNVIAVKNNNSSEINASDKKADKKTELISQAEPEEPVDSIGNKNNDEKQDKPEVFFSLGTNLLAWTALVPNIDFEIRYERFSFNLDGSFAPWKSEKNGHNQYLAFWNVSPEFRYYLGANSVNYLKSYYNKGFYTGLFYNAGFFNLKRDINGNQGFFQSFGVCGGYLLPLRQSVSLDFGLCLGYNLLTIENYADEKDESGQMINYTIKTDKKGLFFPAKAKITIKWTPGAKSKQNINDEK